MVRTLKYIRAFMRLVRWPNLIIIAITMYTMRYAVVVPMLGNTGFQTQINNPIFFCLVLTMVLLAAAGYVINDYFDRKADLINRPGRVILGRILSRRAGMFWHFVLSVSGILLGVFVAYKLHLLRFSIIFFFISGVLWFYSTTYKRQVLLGNIIVSLLVAFVPAIVLLFELPSVLNHYDSRLLSAPTDIDLMAVWILVYAGFAFLLTLAREIIKDLEDFEGDSAFGKQTIPIVWGEKVARWFILTLLFIVEILLLYILIKHQNNRVSLFSISLMLVVPLAILIGLLLKAESKESYSRASLLTKIVMLAGIVYCWLARFFII